jgi:MscS family membrane protein
LGTVDDIGLRSTRIRTLDRTVVTVPNGQIANLSLESLSARDKFWFHPLLSLRCGTTSAQVQAVLDSVRSLLEGSPHLEPESLRVRFLGFGRSSLDVDVFAYALAGDWNRFLEIQEALLLRIMECIESAGTEIAIPSQTIFMAAASNSTEAEMGLLRTPGPRKPRKKTNDPAAKSA